MAKKTIKTSVYRSAKTGKFVTKKYTEKHKDTTVKETVRKTVQVKFYFSTLDIGVIIL